MAADKQLKEFMNEHFDFSTLKKAGVFPKEMKFNDYEGQAARICHFFSLKSIYEYAEIGKGVRCHVSEVTKKPKPLTIPEYKPFIRVIGGENTGEGKVVKFKNDNNSTNK